MTGSREKVRTVHRIEIRERRRTGCHTLCDSPFAMTGKLRSVPVILNLDDSVLRSIIAVNRV